MKVENLFIKQHVNDCVDEKYAYFNTLFDTSSLYSRFEYILNEKNELIDDRFVYIVGQIINLKPENFNTLSLDKIYDFIHQQRDKFNQYLEEQDIKLWSGIVENIEKFYNYPTIKDREFFIKNLKEVVNLEEKNLKEKAFENILDTIKHDKQFVEYLCKISCDNDIELYKQSFYDWFDYIKRFISVDLYFQYKNKKSKEEKKENKQQEDLAKPFSYVLERKILNFVFKKQSMDEELYNLIGKMYEKDIKEYQEQYLPLKQEYLKKTAELQDNYNKKRIEFDNIKKAFEDNMKELQDEFNKKIKPYPTSSIDDVKAYIELKIGKLQQTKTTYKQITEEEVRNKRFRKDQEIMQLIQQKENLLLSTTSIVYKYDYLF